MNKYTCSNCLSHFYADTEIDDFIIGGQNFCSHCYSKVKICGICGKMMIFKRKFKSDIGICDNCRKEHKVVHSVWKTLRFDTFARDNFTCRYCGRSPLKDFKVILHCDHIIPKRKEGRTTLDNLITSCQECNQGKLDVMLSQYQIDLLKNRT